MFDHLFDEEDYQGHPDNNCVEVNPSDYPAAKVVVEERYGRGYVLSDGFFVFPGDDFITNVVTR